jgi:hypothetical protein
MCVVKHLSRYKNFGKALYWHTLHLGERGIENTKSHAMHEFASQTPRRASRAVVKLT